jgi:hypothetical protein
MPILGDFAVKYAKVAGDVGVDTDDLYQALVDTAENAVRAPPNFICMCLMRQTAIRLVSRWKAEFSMERVRVYTYGVDRPFWCNRTSYA